MVYSTPDDCKSLQWRHNGRGDVSNRQPHDCLLNHLFGRRSKKHQSSASLAFVRGIYRWSVNSPHKWPVTRKMFPFDDVIMWLIHLKHSYQSGIGHDSITRTFYGKPCSCRCSNAYLWNHWTEFLRSKFCWIDWESWLFAHIPRLNMPTGQIMGRCGTHISRTSTPVSSKWIRIGFMFTCTQSWF